MPLPLGTAYVAPVTGWRHLWTWVPPVVGGAVLAAAVAAYQHFRSPQCIEHLGRPCGGSFGACHPIHCPTTSPVLWGRVVLLWLIATALLFALVVVAQRIVTRR